MTSSNWKTLVSAELLHQHLHDAQLVIVDCRFELGDADADAGHRAHTAGHLPGAVYAHLNKDLSGPITANSGRHPLPNFRTLSASFSSWGIDAGKQVVAYDADNGAMAAARLWWLLRWLGHERVAVLQGGLKQWQASGFELSTASFVPPATQFVPQVHVEMLVDADTVARHVAHADWRVLDARAPERYAGEVEPLDAVAGHVPGALNHPFNHNFNSDGSWLPATSLREQFSRVLTKTEPHQVISMCGSGVTACQNLLAMEVAGLHGAKLYAGSWSEWSKQRRAVAVGSNR